MIGFDYILLIGSALILLSTAIGKLSDNLGVPTLLLFLAVGMLAGSEGPGGIEFDDAGLASSVGVVALVFILFGGGLDTRWSSVRPILKEGIALSTAGVLLTAGTVGIFAHYALGIPMLHGLLLGSIISSTDAAAVFSTLQSKSINLRGNLKPLLELESGSNDPTAVILTIGLIEMIQQPDGGITRFLWFFVLQFSVGGILGFGLGKGIVLLLNRLRFSYEGFYPVFSLASACFVYALSSVAGGSGFLAVYIAGIVVGNSEFLRKKTLLRFFDGLSWLSQIGMFLTLGLLVFPSRLLPVVSVGLLVSVVLILIARPVSVFLSLVLTRLTIQEKLFISWVGLRGAVPIILATLPLFAGLPNADLMFNLVFFIVLTSALLQGWSIPLAARLLKVDTPFVKQRPQLIELSPVEGIDAELVDLTVPFQAEVIGKSIVELGMPSDSLLVLISRGERYIIPSGGTMLEPGDTILVLVNKNTLPAVREIFSRQQET